MAKKKINTPLIIISFCLYLLVAGCSSSHRTSEPALPKWSQHYLIGAYYYLWYPENWRDGYVNGLLTPPQLPALGEYNSSDLKTIEQHISWSSHYGVNFWAISWWPDHPELDRIIRHKILRAKNIDDIKFCIFYETSGLGLADEKITFTPDKIKKIVSDFKYLA